MLRQCSHHQHLCRCLNGSLTEITIAFFVVINASTIGRGLGIAVLTWFGASHLIARWMGTVTGDSLKVWMHCCSTAELPLSSEQCAGTNKNKSQCCDQFHCQVSPKCAQPPTAVAFAKPAQSWCRPCLRCTHIVITHLPFNGDNTIVLLFVEGIGDATLQRDNDNKSSSVVFQTFWWLSWSWWWQVLCCYSCCFYCCHCGCQSLCWSFFSVQCCVLAS